MLLSLKTPAAVIFGLLTFAPVPVLAAGFACTAKDLISGQSFTESGSTQNAARASAMDECWSETGHVCVVNCVENDISGGFSGFQYACNSTDEADRTWTETGATLQAARTASLAACAEDAGVSCRVLTCGYVR